MAYDFLGLVNNVIKKVNEVELTSANFDSAVGFYSDAKDAINEALREIDVYERFWPWNFNQGAQLLTAGTMKYAFPANTRVIDFDSFIIPQDDTLGNSTSWLRPLTYDDYKQNYVQHEFFTSTSQRNLPSYIVKSPDDNYILVPNPDKAYTVRFDYFATSTELSAHDDVPLVPERYRPVILNGAMRKISLFRESPENSQTYELWFMKGLRDMRVNEINQNLYVRSAMNFRRNPAPVSFGPRNF